MRELPDWPPRFGGAHESGPDLPEFEGVLKGVLQIEHQVTLICRYEGQDSNWHLPASSIELAEKITEVFHQNVGKAASELGELEVS